jgi:hypothetical protein
VPGPLHDLPCLKKRRLILLRELPPAVHEGRRLGLSTLFTLQRDLGLAIREARSSVNNERAKRCLSTLFTLQRDLALAFREAR